MKATWQQPEQDKEATPRYEPITPPRPPIFASRRQPDYILSRLKRLERASVPKARPFPRVVA